MSGDSEEGRASGTSKAEGQRTTRQILSDLSLEDPWALGEDALAQIKAALQGRRPRRILEFGSGTSTVRLALDFPSSSVVAVENHIDFLERTRSLIERFRVDNARVAHCPLGSVCVGWRRFYSYQINPTTLGEGFDLVLIDGPVESTTVQGREAVLYLVFDRIQDGAVIALDDYHRDSAKSAVESWTHRYRDGIRKIDELSTGGLAILEKTSNGSKPRRARSRDVLRNWRLNISHALRRTRRIVGRRLAERGAVER